MEPCDYMCNDRRAFIQLHPQVAAILGVLLPRDANFSTAADGYRIGSHGGRATTDQYDRIDVRLLRRAGSLKLGTRLQVGHLAGYAKEDALVLSNQYDSQTDTAEQHPAQVIQIVRTPCHYGGQRNWLRCPSADCGRRVGILYLREDRIACRQCFGLAYRSQREEPSLRKLQHAKAIRARLGGASDVTLRFPAKPKRMHWQTYQALQKEHNRLLEMMCGS
jgi:hypothetical protein